MVYVVTCDYFSNSDVFGIYSSILKARDAIVTFLKKNPYFIWHAEGEYEYHFVAHKKIYVFEIIPVTLDE